jgi:hypothetical protein
MALTAVPWWEGSQTKQLTDQGATYQSASDIGAQAVGGVFTGSTSKLIVKTIAPKTKGLVGSLAAAGIGAGTALLAGSLFGGKGQEQQQEQQQEQEADQQTITQQAPSMPHTSISTVNTVTKNISTTKQYYEAGGDIYGAPVTINQTPATDITPTQTATQPTYGGMPIQTLDQAQQQGQQALSFDTTGLIIIAALAIGGLLLWKAK